MVNTKKLKAHYKALCRVKYLNAKRLKKAQEEEAKKKKSDELKLKSEYLLIFGETPACIRNSRLFQGFQDILTCLI